MLHDIAFEKIAHGTLDVARKNPVPVSVSVSLSAPFSVSVSVSVSSLLEHIMLANTV
jgi:hypothetical protein